ncbi:MAG: HlyD family type I secretion periplasmic adaptor subunit [Pseudomonadota bacterium]
MNIRDLQYVVSVAEHRNFTRAAKDLNVSQPALSSQIKKLERDFGLDIFERRKDGVYPSEFGAKLVEAARQVSSIIDDIEETAQRFRGIDATPVRLGMTPTLAAYISRYFKEMIAELFPSLRVIIVEEKPVELARLVETQQIDIALISRLSHGLIFGETAGDRMDFTPLWFEPVFLGVNADHWLADEPGIAARGVPKDLLIRFDVPFGYALEADLPATDTQAAEMVGIDVRTARFETVFFDTERRARRAEREILDQRIQSLREEIAGLQEQRASNARQSSISQDELAGLDTLFKKGLVTGNRISAINVEIERLRGSDASLKTAQARAENEIGQLQLTGISQMRLRAEAITTELAGIEARLAEIGPQLAGALERLSRIEIKAPVSGRIVNLAVFTTGGVIRPGADILEIVPDGEALIVEARVQTTDIESLTIGQSARVQLSAFEQDDIPEALGKIANISADSLKDERSGDDYFIVQVAMDETQPPRIAALDLVPGMPVGLFINTGERTAMSYLTAPLRERLRRTFIE